MNSTNIQALLLNSPCALEQVGRCLMTADHPECDLTKITAHGYQQVGFLAIRAMQGEELPKTDLDDVAPLSSHRVTRLTGRFVGEVLLHDAKVPRKLEAAVFQKEKAANTVEITLEQLHQSNLAWPIIPASMVVLIAKRIEMFTQEISSLHPKSYSGNPLGHLIAQYLFFTQLPCAAQFRQDLVAIVEKLIACADSQQDANSEVSQLKEVLAKIDQKIQQIL